MKLVFYQPHHSKNTDAMKQMCKSRKIDLELTDSYDRLMTFDYNILISNSSFIDPFLFPAHVKIIYGPQFGLFPPSGPLMGPLNEELVGRCAFNSLSNWVRDYFLEYGGMIMPIRNFPFAIDVEKFVPSEQEKTLECILYFKHRHPSQKDELLRIAKKLSLDFKFIEYGHYNESEYLNALQKARFMVVLDAHESQGFALQEAMACNIPLVVWNASTLYDEYHGNQQIYENYRPKKLYATSVPYWDDRCGIIAKNAEELRDGIMKMRLDYPKYSPREYVMENLTAEVCMDRILRYFF
jgi:glycosyltransferase involved in cell wall biosynthesis